MIGLENSAPNSELAHSHKLHGRLLLLFDKKSVVNTCNKKINADQKQNFQELLDLITVQEKLLFDILQ